jgi:glycosyltransferase involved in cell wall biosynthesis
MRFLFIHQNFPGQYLHVIRYLRTNPSHEIVFLTERQDRSMERVKKIVYKTTRMVSSETHHYLRDMEQGVLRGQAVAREAIKLRDQGFKPDIMIGHNAWGEILYLKDVFHDVPLLGYFEFFRHPWGGYMDFDPEYPTDFDSRTKHRTMRSIELLGLSTADWGQTASEWQKIQYPARYHDMLSVVHEGIDTDTVRADSMATITVDGMTLCAGDEIITYAARNLEPFRGFHIFMRALPEVLKRRPKAHVVMVGGDEESYSRSLSKGETYRARMLAEVGANLDLGRVHFMGWVPYDTYRRVLQVSAVHVYLTYPFVLSWSMLEAMAAECLLIASRTAPVLEVVKDRENGLLVDFFSTEEIADRIDEALDNFSRMEALRRQARATIVERFDLIGRALPAYLKLLDNVIAQQSAPAGTQI